MKQITLYLTPEQNSALHHVLRTRCKNAIYYFWLGMLSTYDIHCTWYKAMRNDTDELSNLYVVKYIPSTHKMNVGLIS